MQEGDEHGADDRRRAHTGKAGAKAGPHAGKKVTRTVNNTFILCVLLYNFVQIFPDQLHGPEKDLLIGWLHMIQQALEKGILHHTPLAD